MNDPLIPSPPLPRDEERRAERHVMVDLETLSILTNGVFFAIAAVPFDPYEGTMGRPFFVLTNPEDALHYDRKLDQKTIQWWSQQAPEARAYLEASYTDGLPLSEALQRFSTYLHNEVGPKESIRIWGKGGDFDKPFLDQNYAACGLELPWGPRACRCYRSLEAFSDEVPPRHTLAGVAHHALDDTIHQVAQAIPALRHIYRLPPLTAPIVQPPPSDWVEDPLRAVVTESSTRVRRQRSP